MEKWALQSAAVRFPTALPGQEKRSGLSASCRCNSGKWDGQALMSSALAFLLGKPERAPPAGGDVTPSAADERVL